MRSGAWSGSGGGLGFAEQSKKSYYSIFVDRYFRF